MKKYVRVWLLSLLAIATGCQDYEIVEYTAEDGNNGKEIYRGSVLQFLEEGDPTTGYRYDSLLYVIKEIPGLEDSLENNKNAYTLFAVPNESFKAAIDQLNLYRQAYDFGRPLYLKDLVIEPFVVEDTTITILNEEPYIADTVIVKTSYDYRLELKRMVCRYVFKGIYDWENVNNAEGSYLKVSHLKAEPEDVEEAMCITADRNASSGIVGVGSAFLLFSDMNGTEVESLWEQSRIAHMDIYATDGLLQLLDAGHEFCFDDFIPKFQNYGNERKKDDE